MVGFFSFFCSHSSIAGQTSSSLKWYIGMICNPYMLFRRFDFKLYYSQKGGGGTLGF